MASLVVPTTCVNKPGGIRLGSDLHWPMRSIPAVMVAIALQVAGSPAMAQRLPFQKSFDAAGITTLDVSTIRGKINIVSSDAGQVVVGGAVTIRIGIDVPENPLEIARRIAANPPIERVGDTVRLRPPADVRDQKAVTVSYDVRVPANTKILTVSDSGETTIAGVTGSVNVQTQSGAIGLQRVGGGATIATGSGAVLVEGTSGPLTVTTSSSALTARALGGNLRVRTSSGAVNAAYEGAGDVDVETGSSAIQLRGVRGAVSAASRSGRITVEGTPARQWAVTTGSSSIDVAVARPPVTLDATSGSGSVQVAGATVSGTVSKRAVNGAIGSGGPPIRLSTRSGSIRVNVGR